MTPREALDAVEASAAATMRKAEQCKDRAVRRYRILEGRVADKKQRMRIATSRQQYVALQRELENATERLYGEGEVLRDSASQWSALTELAKVTIARISDARAVLDLPPRRKPKKPEPVDDATLPQYLARLRTKGRVRVASRDDAELLLEHARKAGLDGGAWRDHVFVFGEGGQDHPGWGKWSPWP